MSHSRRRPNLLQQAAEPLFVLSRRRRILFVNDAWSKLLGLPQDATHGKACRRYRQAVAGSPEALLGALSPPAEVVNGRPGRVRRLVVSADGSRRWCDLDFLPFRNRKGLLRILGKITTVEESAPHPVALSEKLVALRAEAAQRYRLDALDGGGPALQRVAAQAHLAAQARAAVLIGGEAGTGKAWLAQAIHQHGSRDTPFAAFDCARLPIMVLTAQLFGGGAPAARDPSGTVYLKEPAALPRDLQARLCEWLSKDETARPRFLAGTNVDLEGEVAAGRFLKELYHTLATVVISLPPLRERVEEVPLLIERFLERANADGEKTVQGLTPDALEFLHDYRWPGNLGELFAVLRMARRRAAKDQIDTGDLPLHLRQAVILDRTPGRSPERPVPLDDLLLQVERRLIQLALHLTENKKGPDDKRGRKARAAEVLGMSVPRLLRRMEALGITAQYD
jgi:DNA-binding NtrC family response regulator